MNSKVLVDNLHEKTSSNGIIMNSKVLVDNLHEKTSSNGIIMNSKVLVDNLYEKTGSNGIKMNNTVLAGTIKPYGSTADLTITNNGADSNIIIQTADNGLTDGSDIEIRSKQDLIGGFYSDKTGTSWTSIVDMLGKTGSDSLYSKFNYNSVTPLMTGEIGVKMANVEYPNMQLYPTKTVLTYPLYVDNLYEKTTSAGVSVNSTLKVNTIQGIADDDSGSIYGVPVTNAGIPVDNIVFSPWTLRQFVNQTSCVGCLGKPVITDNTDGSISIAACNIQIRATNSTTADIKFLQCASGGPLSVPENTTRYLLISYNSGSPVYSLSASINTDYQTQILVAQIYRVPVAESNELYINENVCTNLLDLPKNMINSTGVKLNQIHYESGAALGFTGVQWSISQGNFDQAYNPIVTQSKALSGNFRYLEYTGSVWNEVTATNNINNTQYQGASGFTNLTASRWSVDFVYITVDATTKYYLIKSTSQTTSLANALALSVPSTLPSRLVNNGILVGKIVFQNGQNIDSVYSSFNSTMSFQGVTSHSNLANLTNDDHTQYLKLTGRTGDICDMTNGQLILPAFNLTHTTEGGLMYDYSNHQLIYRDNSTFKVVTATDIPANKLVQGNTLDLSQFEQKGKFYIPLEQKVDKQQKEKNKKVLELMGLLANRLKEAEQELNKKSHILEKLLQRLDLVYDPITDQVVDKKNSWKNLYESPINSPRGNEN